MNLLFPSEQKQILRFTQNDSVRFYAIPYRSLGCELLRLIESTIEHSSSVDVAVLKFD